MEGMLNYFIPEDGDSSDHMNVVPLPRVDQLMLQHIKKSFPLPGEFHFRFKTPFEGTYVWLDVTNDSDPIPDFNGLIICKIARVQRESVTRPVERVEALKTQPKPTPDLIETSPEPSPQLQKREEKAVTSKPLNDDLVGFLSDPIPSQSPRAAVTSPPASSTSQTGADPFNLFMGGTSPMNATPPTRPTPSPMQISKPTTPQGQNAFGGSGPFSPMGSSSMTGQPRPGMNMNISQMGPMGMNPMGGGQPQAQQQSSFQGLQWQGMGQPQGMNSQPRPSMGGMGGSSHNGLRQW